MSMENEFRRLVSLMEALRAGCPWDRKQTHASLIPYLREESFEVIEAILAGDDAGLREELGDLLFQVVFHAAIARERDGFTLESVLKQLNDKMERRHPHVFDPDHREQENLEDQWETLKAQEKKSVSGKRSFPLVEDMDSLKAAERLQLMAARHRFDWENAEGVIEQVALELEELRAARRSGDRRREREELGDVLFTMINVCRFLHHDPDQLLTEANRKFQARYERMLALAAETHPDVPFKKLPMEAKEALWQEVKKMEREKGNAE